MMLSVENAPPAKYRAAIAGAEMLRASVRNEDVVFMLCT
jgi:hypothetical protein